MGVVPTLSRDSIPLQAKVVCPHCWHGFAPEQALWIAESPDLLNDPRLGPEHLQRFLPSRFNLECAAIDANGFPCRLLACPGCHLEVPRAVFEIPQVFISILGAPASGKSYFLASMTWQLRQILSKSFSIYFDDADPAHNVRLHHYEQTLFMNPNPDAFVNLDKTETQGDLYDTVMYNGQSFTYPKPFLFTLKPLAGHPHVNSATKLARVLSLYDNAGESFLPGQEKATSPVTRHLAESRLLFFLFDPTQDPRFRQACQGKTKDPQMLDQSQRRERASTARQDSILREIAQRVRRFTNLGQNDKHPQPLIVVVTKYDAWSALVGPPRLEEPLVRGSQGSLCALRPDKIEDMSKRVRTILVKYSPEIVTAAEDFAETVLYIPASATGCSPEVDKLTGTLGFRPRNFKPMWMEVPVVYALCRWLRGLIPHVRSTAAQPAPEEPSAPRIAPKLIWEGDAVWSETKKKEPRL